ncbi:MAG: transcriptional regulator, partial [Alteraurantiacibacter sp.]
MAENLAARAKARSIRPRMSDIAATYRFDAFTLDTADRRLCRDGVPVELGSRYFDALVLLVEERGGLVSKERFMDEVWRGIPVTDEALTQCIRTLRRALGDDAANPRFIRTVPKHGYRFVGELEGEPESVEQPPANAPVRYALPSRVVGACTLAGLAAGVLGGGFYGIAASDGQALILAAMIGCLG